MGQLVVWVDVNLRFWWWQLKYLLGIFIPKIGEKDEPILTCAHFSKGLRGWWVQPPTGEKIPPFPWEKNSTFAFNPLDVRTRIL